MSESKAPATYLRTVNAAREASGRAEWVAAISLWETVVENNPTRADFWLALGNASYAAGRYAPAVDAYRVALDLGGGYPFETAYQIARCMALTGQIEMALEWIELAFALGYRDLELVQSDEMLAPLHQVERFRDLVGLIDRDRLARDDGWRYDLAFFTCEVKRKAFHPWRMVSEREFDAQVAEVNSRIPDLSDYEILIELRRLLTRLGDGHASAAFPAEHELAPATLPVQFYLFEEGLFITATEPDHASLLGCQVLAFGDHTLSELFEVITPTVPRDNDQWLKLKIPYIIRELAVVHALGLVAEADRVQLTLRTLDGEERKVVLEAVDSLSTDELYYALPAPDGWESLPNSSTSSLPRQFRNQAAYYWFEYIANEKTVYFQFNRVRNSEIEDLATFSERLFRYIDDHAVHKLVIDLRNNNGGNTYLEMPFLHRLIGSRINQRGRLFVIIGRRTFSAAQNLSSMLEQHTEATFVGEPTGASPNFYGENITIELPYSRLAMNVSDLYWQSSWPTDYRTWIAPLLYIPPTFAAYRENRDPALDAILAWGDHLPGQ